MKVIKPWTEFWFAQAGGAVIVHLKSVPSPHFRNKFTNKIVTEKVKKSIAYIVLSSQIKASKIILVIWREIYKITENLFSK